MKLDIYVDAGSYQNKFSIGAVFYIKDIEVYKISEIIPKDLKINDIQNAELYAIDRALSICKEASVTSKEIILHCDNQDALTLATNHVEFKNCLPLLKGHVVTHKGQLKKNFNCTLHFLKIASADNHGKAHDVASDALQGKVYEKGHKHYLALSSKEILKKMNAQVTENTPKKEESQKASTTSIVDTLNVNKIFQDAGNSFTKLQEDLFKKKKALMDLKVQLMHEQTSLNALKSSIDKYQDRVLTLRKSVEDAQSNRDSILFNLNKNTELISSQQNKIIELDTLITLKSKEADLLSNKESLRLKIYQEEYERLTQEVEYLKSIKNFDCEAI